MAPREIRELLGLTVEDVAAATGSRTGLVRRFEKDALSVGETSRGRLVAHYLKLWRGVVRVAAVVGADRVA